MGKFDGISFYGHENEELQKEYERTFHTMTKEEKQLLLKDLCARLPYGVKVTDGLHTITLKVRIDTAPATLAQFMQSENLRYYLRPMSSMTEEEEKEIEEMAGSIICYNENESGSTLFDEVGLDWLNAHHFDYRGLIEKGLAIEVTEENNPYEK